MFSLIITIISIALVAVLALATLYYGGDAFNKGSADAQAAKIVNQGQQLLGAAEMFFVDNKTWPTNVQALIDGGYLKSAPVAYQGNGTVSQAWAAAAWEMPVAGQPVFVADVSASDACRAVNKRSLGLDGILDQARTSLITQCYGADIENLKAVVAKNSASLLVVADTATPVAVPGLLPAGDILEAAAPAASDPDAWLAGYTPTGSAASGGGSGGGSISPPSGGIRTNVTLAAGPAGYLDFAVSTADGVDISHLAGFRWSVDVISGAPACSSYLYDTTYTSGQVDVLSGSALQTCGDSAASLTGHNSGTLSASVVSLSAATGAMNQFDGLNLTAPATGASSYTWCVSWDATTTPASWTPLSITSGACPILLPTE